jgi:hypothetical protein
MCMLEYGVEYGVAVSGEALGVCRGVAGCGLWRGAMESSKMWCGGSKCRRVLGGVAGFGRVW